MADAKKNEGTGPQKAPLQEDRIVAQLVSGAAQAPTGLTSYVGLLSRSPTAGRWRLYLSLDMSAYVEFAEEDIVHSEQLPADRSPFGSLGGTQIFVKKGAEVTATQTVTRTVEAGGAADEFDLDIRLGAPASMAAAAALYRTKIGNVPGGTCETCRTQCDTCPGDTCRTCGTCHHGVCAAAQPLLVNTKIGVGGTCETCATCDTCRTVCDQATCNTCHTGVCATCATCHTCQTLCGQATCHTCAGQATCHTCAGQATCHTCQNTCVACTHVTCYPGCRITAALPC
jgi:hypothetical protein